MSKMGLPKEIRMNYDDYCKLPEDGKRYEIIEGELFNAPAPSPIHQTISWNLTVILDRYLRQSKIGRAFTAPIDVVLGREDIVQPDIIYISKEWSEIIKGKNIQGVPDLIIEILSPGKEEFDRKIKCKLYSKYKVKEYWIINPTMKTLEKLCLKGETLQLVKKYRGEETIESQLLPGLRIKLGEVFT